MGRGAACLRRVPRPASKPASWTLPRASACVADNLTAGGKRRRAPALGFHASTGSEGLAMALFDCTCEATSGHARALSYETAHGNVPDAHVHARGHERHGEGRHRGSAARPRRPGGAREHVPPVAAPRRRRGGRGGRGAPLHELRRPHAHRFGRVPGVQPGRHAQARRRRPHVPLHLRRLQDPLDARGQHGHPGSSLAPTSPCSWTNARPTRPSTRSWRRPWTCRPTGRAAAWRRITRPDQTLFGIVQGGMELDLRLESIRRLRGDRGREPGARAAAASAASASAATRWARTTR